MKISICTNSRAAGLIQIFDGTVAALNIGLTMGHPLWTMVFATASIWCVLLGAPNLAS